MAVEIYEGTYRGHAIYYYQYEDGGVYRASGIDGTFNTYTEVKTAIDQLEGEAPGPDVGDQTPPREDLLEVGSYRGVILYQDQNTLALIFRINDIPYIAYAGYPEAKNIIDSALGAPRPGEEGYIAPETQEPGEIQIPFPWGWIGDVLNWFKGLWTWAFGGLSGIPNALNGFATALNSAINKIPSTLWASIQAIPTIISALPDAFFGYLVEHMGELFTRSTEESIKKSLELLPGAVGHSPEWKSEIEGTVKPFAEESVNAMLNAVNPEKYTHSTLEPSEAANQLTILGATVAAANIGVWIAHVAAEAATLGQLEAIGQLSNIVINSLGVNALSSRALMIPIEKSILIPAEQHYNSVYTPEIPSYQDLINQVVKEVITLDTFKIYMKRQGYNEEWAQRIWDAHFIPPSLTDILTAWRRGKITESDVDRLMVLVDLDPRFKEIFDTRKYVDPPLSVARFMFESGVITRAEVHELVKRQGYTPEHTEFLTNYITEFQERLWRRRYLVTLSGGYQKGVYSGGDLEKAVVDAGYTPDVAKWIIANADARKKISESGEVEARPKLLSVADLKKAYILNFISTDQLRTDILLRGYPTDQAELMIKLLDQEKVVTTAGGSKIALTVAEMVDAWQYDEMNVDELRAELMLRGMDQMEVERLIRTKIKKWEFGEKKVPESQ